MAKCSVLIYKSNQKKMEVFRCILELQKVEKESTLI